jgi:hypothetical protein
MMTRSTTRSRPSDPAEPTAGQYAGSLTRIVVFVLCAIGLVAEAASLAPAQSLAEVAQKESERRKEIAEPAKLYTNKDLSNVPQTGPAAPAESAKPAASTATKSESEQPPAQEGETEPVKDQAYWSGRTKQLRAQLDRDETYVEALQSRVNSLAADFVNRDDPAQRSVIALDRQKAIAELNRLKQAIVADRKAIDDCEEEARRTGVPPGWLRD